ncbi:hypothetical protein ACJIZ3_011673 [Penstemon smallii]|uniref:Transposase n=1 Tax=Penstemon smallii TaxID=265156 RepID=A0ABD3ULF7_9LAMI
MAHATRAFREYHCRFNFFRGGLGTLSGYLSQQGFEPESATL